MFSAKFTKTLLRSPTRDVLFTSLTMQYYVLIVFFIEEMQSLLGPIQSLKANGSCLITQNYIWACSINLCGIGTSVRDDLLEFFFCP